MLYIHQKTMISVQALIVSGSLGWTIFTSFADGFARAVNEESLLLVKINCTLQNFQEYTGLFSFSNADCKKDYSNRSKVCTSVILNSAPVSLRSRRLQ